MASYCRLTSCGKMGSDPFSTNTQAVNCQLSKIFGFLAVLHISKLEVEAMEKPNHTIKSFALLTAMPLRGAPYRGRYVAIG
jgi:hypothetical protein